MKAFIYRYPIKYYGLSFIEHVYPGWAPTSEGLENIQQELVLFI